MTVLGITKDTLEYCDPRDGKSQPNPVRQAIFTHTIHQCLIQESDGVPKKEKRQSDTPLTFYLGAGTKRKTGGWLCGTLAVSTGVQRSELASEEATGPQGQR